MRRETSRQIDSQAAEWVARLESGLSPEEEAELDHWLGADPRREGAFMRMRAIAFHSERAKALGAAFDADLFSTQQEDRKALAVDEATLRDLSARPSTSEIAQSRRDAISRRKVLWGGGAIAASLAVAMAGWSIYPRGELYQTALGQTQVVTLADGSVMTLNTDTKLRVRFSDAERRIELDHGEVLFDVAHNKLRPFIVSADSASVRAVGTSFTVKKLADQPLAVMVAQGTVELTRASMASPVRVSADNVVTVSEKSIAPKPTKISPQEVDRAIAWRAGQIAFEGESLAEASAEFARYSHIKIIIDDPTVGREEITGLFASNDPVSFARAAATSLGLKADVGNGEVHLTR